MAEFKSVDIASTHVDPEGGLKENRNPVIFLHAMLCSKEVWGDVPQMVANATGRRVYTYDARNHGDSDASKDSNFKFNVDDLFKEMDKITAEMDSSPKQFVLVGHDMGGMTAMSATLSLVKQKEDKVEKLFVVEMYAKPIKPLIIERTKTFTTTWAECVRKIPEKTDHEDVGRLSVEDLYENLDKSMQEPNEKESYKKGIFSFKKTGGHYDVKYHTEYILNALDELKNFGKYDGQFRGPTYFFYGSESHFKVKDESVVMLEHFPQAKLVEFKKGSHFFIADFPAELAKELIELI